MQHDVPVGGAGHTTHRGGVAQGLVEGGVEQPRVFLHRPQLLGMLEEQAPHVQDGAPSGVTAAAHQHRDHRHDLGCRHVAAVDVRAAQLGDDVLSGALPVLVVEVRGLPAPLLDELPDVLLEILASLEAYLGLLGARSALLHRPVPVVEAVPGLGGEPQHVADDADRELVGERPAQLDRSPAGDALGDHRLGGRLDRSRDHLHCQAMNGRETSFKSSARELGAEDPSAAGMLAAAKLKNGVAVHQVRAALGDGVVRVLVEVRGHHVGVAGNEVPVVQPVPVDGIVVAQDAVVGVRVPPELGAVEDPGIYERPAVGGSPHVIGGSQRHRDELDGVDHATRRFTPVSPMATMRVTPTKAAANAGRRNGARMDGDPTVIPRPADQPWAWSQSL